MPSDPLYRVTVIRTHAPLVDDLVGLSEFVVREESRRHYVFETLRDDVVAEIRGDIVYGKGRADAVYPLDAWVEREHGSVFWTRNRELAKHLATAARVGVGIGTYRGKGRVAEWLGQHLDRFNDIPDCGLGILVSRDQMNELVRTRFDR